MVKVIFSNVSYILSTEMFTVTALFEVNFYHRPRPPCPTDYDIYLRPKVTLHCLFIYLFRIFVSDI